MLVFPHRSLTAPRHSHDRPRFLVVHHVQHSSELQGTDDVFCCLSCVRKAKAAIILGTQHFEGLSSAWSTFFVGAESPEPFAAATSSWTNIPKLRSFRTRPISRRRTHDQCSNTLSDRHGGFLEVIFARQGTAPERSSCFRTST